MAVTSVAEGLVGVRFVEAGPISYCSPASLNLGTGDYVVVRTDRGDRLGWVVLAADQTQGARFDGPVRVIDRLATERDVTAYREQQARAAEDLHVAQAIATRRDPRVRIASLGYDLDGRYADLTFVAREQDEGEWLRREAARQLNANVQVEQVGDRDRAKALGGIGQCGRALCCATWQVEFPAISIKMAKDQGLAPNPSKISGVCGRLLCCLSFEIDAYREIIGTLPKVGKRISTPVGRAKVLSINALSETVRMRMDETGEVVEMPAAALREQYGTAVRPVDLEEAVETPLHEQDRDRRDHFLGVLEPVSMPTAPRRTTPDRPSRDRTDRTPRPERTERPARPPRDGAAADAPAGERPARRPRRDRTAESPGGTSGAAPGTQNARPGRPGIAGRRSGRRPGAAEGAPEAPRAERTDRAERPARPPRPEGSASPGAPTGDAEEQKRRRRRGRRGGRGRGTEGGTPEGGAPASE